MNRKTLLTLCAATVLASTTALGIVMAKPASLLGSTSWVGNTSRDWNNANNWTNRVPAAGDTVTVNPTPGIAYKGDPVLSSGSNGLAGDLTIGSDFSVTVTGKTLTLDGAVTHDFDGDLILSNSTAVVKFTADATVNGDGAIIGQDDSAEIQIATGKVLTSTMPTVGIVGQMKIAGPGTFDNRGLVYANDSGTLTLGENLLLDDSEGAVRWKAGTNIGAVLFFDNAHTGGSKLDGDFAVANCATLKFDATIETNGDFDIDAAAGFVDLDVANSVEFRYNCGAVGGCTVIDSDQTYGGC